MKRNHMFLCAALLSASLTAAAQSTNGTVTDGWLMVEDFEGTTTAAATNKYGSAAEATLTIEARPDDATNKGAHMSDVKGYNTIIGLDVTLPTGKELKHYKNIAFDLYRYADDSNYKKMLVKAGNDEIYYSDYIQHASTETWTVKTYPITDATAGNSFTLLVGIESDAGNYMIDNIRLEAKTDAELDAEEHPVEATPSTNGTVTDGWLMVEDFQNGDNAVAVNVSGGSVSGFVTVAPRDDDRANLAANMASAEGYNTVIGVEVTLPTGKVLKDYKTIKFDLYRMTNDDNYKKMIVQAGDDQIYLDDNYVQQAPATTWTEKSYEISADVAAGNTFTLMLGIESDNGNYMIDNIQLEEREAAAPSEDGDDAIVNPGMGSGDNYVNGWLIVEDFEGIELSTSYVFCQGNGSNDNNASTKGTSEVVDTDADSKVGKTRALKAVWSGNYDTVGPKLVFTLPRDITEYSSISFDLMRDAANDYKPLNLYINGTVIVNSENNGMPTNKDTWTTKTYSIEGKGLEGTNEIMIVLYSNVKAGWTLYIDNIRLQPKYEIPTGPAENAAIELSDDNDYSFTEEYEVPSVTYTRTVSHNDWHAICLPFAVTDWSTFADDVIELTGVTEADGNVALEFSHVAPGALAAGKPYIFKPAADAVDITEEEATITPDITPATAGAYTLTGAYATTSMAGNYALKDGTFYKGSAVATLKPFRAYITTNAAQGAPAKLAVKIDGEVESGIQAVIGDNDGDTVTYNLQGVRVDRPTRGIYIRGGKKIIVK